MILANECVGDLGSDTKIVLYIVPEWSFELGNRADLEGLRNNNLFRPTSGSGWLYRYNADGYCIFSCEYKTEAINAYTQVFHSGIIEAVEIRLISNYRSKEVYNWLETQGIIIRALNQYGSLLEEIGVPKPWHIFGTILNGKGYIASAGWGEYSQPLDRDIINSLDGVCTEDIPLDIALKPVFDSLSNAFGFSKSGHFD